MKLNVLLKITLATVCLFAAGSLQATESQHKVVASIIEQENAGKILAAMSRARANFLRYADNDLARLTYGRLLVKNGKADKAIGILTPLANQHGDDWRPWFWLGSAQLMSKQLDDAAWSMDEALSREGNRVAIWVQRAVIEQERGHPQAAANMLQVADSIEPGNIDVLVNYAYALERAGALDKASVVYRRFLKASASSAEVGRLRSRVLTRLTSIENLRHQQQTVAEAGPVEESETEALVDEDAGSELSSADHDKDSLL